MHDLACSSRLVWTLVALGLGACTIQADHDGTSYRCDELRPCPGGQACVAGTCQAGPDAGAGVDGNDSNPGGTCGTMTILHDDFADPAVSGTRWWDWTWGGITMMHDAGDLVLHFPEGTSNSDGGYSSQQRYLLAGGRVSAEIAQVDTSSEVGVILEVERTDGRWVRVRQRRSTLYLEHDIDDMRTQLATLPYSEIEHRWWQLREQDGTVYWETSPDGSVWTARASAPSAPFLGAVRVHIWAYVYNHELPATTIRVASINGSTPSQESWCPAETFGDDFDDGVLNPLWATSTSGGCELDEVNGALRITHPDRYSHCGISSTMRYDLRRSSVTAQVPQVSDAVSAYLWASLPDDDEVELGLEAGEIHCNKRVQGSWTTATRVPYDPDAHRWWRIRGEDGIVYWEISSDRQRWELLTSHGSPVLPLDAVSIGVGSSSRTSGEAVFDNVNVAP